jgi:hypothetical protein
MNKASEKEWILWLFVGVALGLFVAILILTRIV